MSGAIMVTMYVIHFVDSPFTNLPSLPKFKEPNFKLNREVLEFERRAHDGTPTLMGDSIAYERPSVGLEVVETQAHVLGASEPVPASDESVEERRRRILEATLNLLKEEEEIEDSQRANRNSIGTDACIYVCLG